jgi:membrane associated rhomboid family serine protease
MSANPVLVLLVASVVIVSAAAWGSKGLRGAFVLWPYGVKRQKQFHRLLTAGWVHADPGHLFFNMLTLWFFAPSVMAVLGIPRFLVLYVTAVVVAFIPTTLRFMNKQNYSSLGASGATSAIVFSAIVAVPGIRVGLPFVPGLFMPGWLYGIAYLAYSAYHSWRSKDGINHDAHFSGAIYGALLTFVLEPQRVQRTLQAMF